MEDEGGVARLRVSDGQAESLRDRYPVLHDTLGALVTSEAMSRARRTGRTYRNVLTLSM